MTFREQYVDFQRIVGELSRLRAHNTSFESDNLELFFFAEGTVVLLALERFLRMILGGEATDADTLPNLLEKATSSHLDLIILPGRLDTRETIKRIRNVRNTLAHGNYEQAARQSGLKTKDEYFKTGMYIADVEGLYKILNRIVKQIDADTGRPHPRNHPDMQDYLRSEDFLDLRRTAQDEQPVKARLSLR